MLKKMIVSTLCIAAASSFSSFAYVIGGSNFTLSEYPPFRSYYYSYYTMSYNDLQQMRREVEQYVENGNNDIKRIQEAQQEAIKKYNDAVDDYNRRQQSSYY